MNPVEKLAIPDEGQAMRVVHVITGLAVGGAEAMLVKLLARMDRKRFDPVVVSLMSGGPNRDVIAELGIPIHELGMRPGLPDPIVLSRLACLARRLRPDLIQGWMYHGNLAALWARAWAPFHVASTSALRASRRGSGTALGITTWPSWIQRRMRSTCCSSRSPVARLRASTRSASI